MVSGKEMKPADVDRVKESNNLFWGNTHSFYCLGRGRPCRDNEICLREDGRADFADDDVLESVGVLGASITIDKIHSLPLGV